jgi:hypothetical protein
MITPPRKNRPDLKLESVSDLDIIQLNRSFDSPEEIQMHLKTMPGFSLHRTWKKTVLMCEVIGKTPKKDKKKK